MPIQILIIIAVVIAIIRITMLFRRQAISIKEFAGWGFLWMIVGIIGLQPEIINYLADILGVGRGVDVAIYSAILALFYLIFKLYVKLDKAEQNITKLVRELAKKNKDD